MLTTTQIEARLNNIDVKIEGLTTQLERLNTDLGSKITTADLTRSYDELKELIRTNSITISEMEQKLAKVILPEETRFYLEGSEVSDFQSNFNSLKAMMSKFDKLYKSLVAYASK
jgi:hypothetical protein